MNRTKTGTLANNNRRWVALAFLCLSFIGTSAAAQTEADTRSDRSLPSADDLVELDDSMLAGPPDADRVLSFRDGLDLLYENNRSIAIARQAIEDADVLNQQIIAIYFPQASVEARYTINDEEIEFNQGNVYAPLGEYLDSVYENDPALQATYPFDATPENCSADPSRAADARCLALRETESGIIQYRHDYAVSATLTQPLFNGQIFAGRKLAQLAEESAYASVEQTGFNLQEAYITTYFQAVSLRDQIQIARRNLDNAKLTYEQARILFEEEAGSRFDVTRAQVSLSSAVRNVRNAYLAYFIAIESLATLMNTEPNFNVTQPDELPEPASLESLFENAFEDRPDIEVAEQQVQQSELNAERAKALWYPSLVAQATGNIGRASALSGDAFSWSISAILSWDIYDGGTRRREQRTAEIEQVRREIQLEQLEDDIRTNIRSAWLEYQTQKVQVETAEAEVELAAENLELTREANALGAASSLEVDVAQNQLFQSELVLNDARNTLQRLKYNLYRLSANRDMIPLDVQ